MTLKGLEQLEDLQVKSNLLIDRKLLQQNFLWSIDFMPRDYNRCAHNAAKWEKLNSLTGFLEPMLLFAAAWCDRGKLHSVGCLFVLLSYCLFKFNLRTLLFLLFSYVGSRLQF